jgi:hypothetical protein
LERHAAFVSSAEAIMQRTGTLGAIIAIVLLARCGGADRPLPFASAPVAALAPHLPPVTEASSVPVPEVPPPRKPTRSEVVRELVRLLGTPGRVGLVFVDETGKPLPGQERSEVEELRALGVAAFADYDAILADPKSEWEEINGVCSVICELKTGRQFLPALVQRLAAPDAMVPGIASRDRLRKFVRESILFALGELGDERDAWVALRVLRRDGRDSWHAAGAALAKIGGQRELEAFDQWLSEQKPGDPLVRSVRKHRDTLELRLLTQPARRTF